MKICLNQDWSLLEQPLDYGPEAAPLVSRTGEGWMDACVPVDVTQVLIAHNRIKDPVLADYSLHTAWVENRSWWFRRNLAVTPEALQADVMELTFDSLDAEADVFVNGAHVGHQRSSFYPFCRDVKRFLRPGDNELLVRLTSGIDRYSQAEAASCNSPENHVDMRDNRGDIRRVMVRKPQYEYGWDWGPRAATCGIVGNAYLRCITGLTVRGVRAETLAIAPQARLHVLAEVENVDPVVHQEGDVEAALFLEGREVARARVEGALICSGINYFDLELTVPEPQLWWPNGYGEQPLYELRVCAKSNRGEDAFAPVAVGIRTLELDQTPLRPGERLFAFRVNGVRVFSQGGDWIPSDSIYCRVSAAKYDALVREAKEANFTMLRVWGGGLYENAAFYQACDRYGILVWQDFMMACALYPDQLDWFREEFRREAVYQVRRLRNHPCLALWCGNNENHWLLGPILQQRGLMGNETGGFHCYNLICPEVVRQHSPAIPFWNSSPYGGQDPNAHELGDRHHWHDCTMHPEMEKRITPEEYDKITSKFVSEYGYIGPCRYSTIERYHDGAPVDRRGFIWDMHNNTFEKETVPAGIEKHYGGAAGMPLEQYLLYAPLVQGLMYHYSLTALRFKPDCSGALFWMYNDTWGEVGWTIIDYYLTRKPSYYFVKRAFAPRSFILRRQGEEIVGVATNDGPQPCTVTLQYGYLSFDGKQQRLAETSVELPAHFRGEVVRFRPDGGDERRGAYILRAAEDLGFAPAMLRGGVFKELELPRAQLTVSDIVQEGEDLLFTVSADAYAHAVHFGLGDTLRLSDEFFDLLPGESRRVRAYGAAGARIQAQSVYRP